MGCHVEPNITFNNQSQNTSSLETYFQSTSKTVISELRPQSSGVLSSAGKDYRNFRIGYYFELLALRREDAGASAYIKGPAIHRRRICEAAHVKFLELARSEYFEYGYTQPSERHLLQFAIEFPALIGELVQDIYLAESANTDVMLALLNAMASLNYETVRPYGQVLAIAALLNRAAEVKEAAIRVYETWGHREGAKILATVECPWPWLDDYRKQVISDLGGDT